MEEKKNYVYVHHVIDADLYYVGRTSQEPKQRFQRACYKGTGIYEYTNKKYSCLLNDPNINTTIMSVRNKNQSKLIEDRLILFFKNIDKSLNKFRSGINGSQQYRIEHREERIQQCKDWRALNEEHVKNYNKQYKDTHKDEIKERIKKWRSTPAGIIYSKVESFNRHHPDKKVETALEARNKFLESGYIPDYIVL